MGDIVNFYRFRKKRAKKEALSKAGENRASHGRTKNEKQRDKTESARMDGLSAIKLIRKFNGAKAKVPIVCVTTYAMGGDKEKFLKIGADAYIAKLFRKEQIAAFADSYLAFTHDGTALHTNLSPLRPCQPQDHAQKCLRLFP